MNKNETPRLDNDKAHELANQMKEKMASNKEIDNFDDALIAVEAENINSEIEEKKREDIFDVGKKEINAIYKSYTTNRERVDIVKEAVKNVSQNVENPDVVLANIEACVVIENKKKFVDAIFQAALPLINLKIHRPGPFVPAGEDSRERIRFNNLLSYEIKGDCLNLHISPNQTIGNAPKEIIEGFHGLAELVRDKKEIKKIEGESWIVAQHPRVAERLGFTLDEKNSRSETGKVIRKAYMTRDDFLRRYLVENKK